MDDLELDIEHDDIVSLLSYSRFYRVTSHTKVVTTYLQDLFKQEYGTRSLKQCYKSIECMSYNLLRVVSRSVDGFTISSDRDQYNLPVIVNGISQDTGVGYQATMKLLDLLSENGLLDITKGWRFSLRKRTIGYAMMTVSCRQLIDSLIKKVEVDLPKIKEECVMFLKGTDGVSKTYRKTKVVNKMLNTVKNYNEMMSKHKVCVDGKSMCVDLHRSFSRGDFEHGGRFYTSGMSVQQLSKAVRSTLTIDGESVVELDYKALHPSILYELEDAILDDGFDVYYTADMEIGISKKVFDEYVEMKLANTKFHPVRNLFKKGMLILINSSSYTEAVNALSHAMREDRSKDYRDQDFLGVVVQPKFVIDKLKERNITISKYFHSDIGIKLQRKDSDIIEKVIEWAIETNTPIVPVHDSIICRKRDIGSVLCVMKESYKQVIGSDFNCRIEV